MHDMLAMLTEVKEFELEPDEAKKLGAAMARVQKLYGKYVIPEKWAAWGGLGMAAVGVYGPRIAAYRLRMENEKAEKKGQVIDAIPINQHVR